MPFYSARRNLFSSVALFPVDFGRLFLYKETPDRRYQTQCRVSQRFKAHATHARQAGLVVAESLFAKPLTVVCAQKNELRQTETGGFKRTRFPFLFYLPDPFS